MLAGSEEDLNLWAESQNWIVVRHKRTAFLTRVGGRAFLEAVGSRVWEWKGSLTGLEDRVKERNAKNTGSLRDHLPPSTKHENQVT